MHGYDPYLMAEALWWPMAAKTSVNNAFCYSKSVIIIIGEHVNLGKYFCLALPISVQHGYTR
jgi:hypothetical protein